MLRDGFAEQLDRAFASLGSTQALRAKSASLVFVEATVLGRSDGEVAIAVDGTTLRLTAPDDHPTLPYRDNLRLIGELKGRALKIIAHVQPERPRTLAAIALAAGGDALALPEAFGGRVNLGLDVLTRAHLVAPQRFSADVPVDASADPLVTLRRRLVALALGGVRSLPPEAQGRVEAERSQLTTLLMPGAASCLAACHGASARAAPHLGDAFLLATTYERAATLHLQRATFRG